MKQNILTQRIIYVLLEQIYKFTEQSIAYLEQIAPIKVTNLKYVYELSGKICTTNTIIYENKVYK